MKEVYIITKESGTWDSVQTVIHGAYLSLESARKAKNELEEKIEKLKSELKTAYYKAEFTYKNPDLEFHTILIEKHEFMGVKSTYQIKRETAIQAILGKIYSASDRELETILEETVNSPFHNFEIVSELDQDCWNTIEHVGQLP